MVALQALALYSENTAGNALDLRVKLTSEVEVDWKPPEIHITPDNALLRREIDVSMKITLVSQLIHCVYLARLITFTEMYFLVSN